MFKRTSWAWAMSPLLALALSSTQVSLAQSPSKGPAGSTSGNVPTAASNTTFSVPVTVSAPGAGGSTPVSGNLAVTTGAAGQPPTISAPPAITNAVAAAGTSAVITLSTGNLTQQQIATLVSAVATVTTSLQGSVPGEIIVSTLQGNNTIGQQTFTTLSQAFTALSAGLGNVANIPNGAFSLQVGEVRVNLIPSNR